MTDVFRCEQCGQPLSHAFQIVGDDARITVNSPTIGCRSCGHKTLFKGKWIITAAGYEKES